MADNEAGTSPNVAEEETRPATIPSDILPAEHWAQQELPHDDDQDSALGDNTSSGSTSSLSESILEYRTINGRTYHSNKTNARYWGPNDEAQNNSMDINNHLLTLALDGKLFLAPISDQIQNVVDIGTGTGVWAIDFADEFPNAQVIGTDISPIQPTWLPPNLRFEIDDATLEWTFQPDHFDFIHIRYLFGSIAGRLAKPFQPSLSLL